MRRRSPGVLSPNTNAENQNLKIKTVLNSKDERRVPNCEDYDSKSEYLKQFPSPKSNAWYPRLKKNSEYEARKQAQNIIIQEIIVPNQ